MVILCLAKLSVLYHMCSLLQSIDLFIVFVVRTVASDGWLFSICVCG